MISCVLNSSSVNSRQIQSTLSFNLVSTFQFIDQHHSAGACLHTVSCTAGGVYAANGNLTFKGNTRFARNVAEFDGGAIAMVAPDQVNMSGSTFVSNEARLGGALSLTSLIHKQRIYHNCTFVNNTAIDGGAMYLYGDAGVDSVTGSLFRDNYASKRHPTNA